MNEQDIEDATRPEPEATDPRPDPEATHPRPEPEATGRPGLVRIVVPWLLVVALAVVAAVLFTQLRTAQDRAAQVDAVGEAAGLFARDLTSWDATDGMADTREELRARSTETFAAEVDQLFGGSDDLAQLEELGARSESEVTDVLVSRVDGDEAEALAVVTQRVTTEVTEGEEISQRYARMTMRRDGDGWRVEDLELAVDLLQQTADRTPIGGANDGEPGAGDGAAEGDGS